jgi:hypothetical protein
MTTTANWDAVGTGLILLCLFGIAMVTWCFFDRQAGAAEERRMLRSFEQQLASAELPPWNGLTWDWPEGDLAAYLADPYGYEPSQVPVPPSTVSGPLPVLSDDEDSADAFIAAMRSHTDAWIAHFAPAGAAA